MAVIIGVVLAIGISLASTRTHTTNVDLDQGSIYTMLDLYSIPKII